LTDDLHWYDQPYDSLTRVWESARHGVFHAPIFRNTYVPTDTGYQLIVVALDADSTIDEWSDTNNVFMDTIYVHQEQSEPYMNWIQPNLEIVECDTNVEIIWEAFNSPDYEYAIIDFYWDDDDQDFNGAYISEGSAIPIINGEDSFTLQTEEFHDSTYYYLYASLFDGYFWPPSIYAPQPIYVLHAVVEDTTDTNTVVRGDELFIPEKFEISALYPNPFNPTVEITIAVPEAGKITARWYSLEGRLVDTQEVRALPGYQKMSWSPNNLASGMYILQLSSPMGQAVAKVMYLK
jgi:hypothetical protein